MKNNLVVRLGEELKAKATAIKVAGTSAGFALVASCPAWAAEGDAGITVNFDTTQMFTFANIIIESLMPVVYITAGLGIGFLIINSLKNAFH